MRISLWLRFKDRKRSLETPSELTNPEASHAVCVRNGSNKHRFVHATFPAAWGGAGTGSASAADHWAPCPHTLCPRFSRLHVPSPVASPRGSAAALPSWPPWVLFAVLVWIGKSFPGATACLQSLENTAQSLRRQDLCPKGLGLFPGCLGSGGMLTLFTHGCLMHSPLVRFGRKNL